MQYRYTTGKRKGLVTPSIMNGNGVEIAGIQYTVTLKGPAVFDQTGTNTISGTTTNEAIHLSWTATGNGKVTSIVQHKIPKATRLESPNQNLMGPTDPQTVSKNIQFEVLNNFKPTIRSDQSDHRIEYGHAPEDDLTWHVDPTGGDWIQGATIKSTGTLYYFANKPVEGRMTVRDGVKAATATASGDRDGATSHVDASSITMDPGFVKAHPGATPSSLPATGWYTWVWQITPGMQDAIDKALEGKDRGGAKDIVVTGDATAIAGNDWTALKDCYKDGSAWTSLSGLDLLKMDELGTVSGVDGGGAAFGRLAHVWLPDTMGSIGDYAFSGCTSLRLEYLPEGVTSVGAGAFQG